MFALRLQLPPSHTHGLPFYMALCMLQREYFSGLIDRGDGFVLLGMTDSSPIGNYNWQNTSFEVIKGQELRDCGRAAQYLAGHRREDDILMSDEEAHQMRSGICEFQCSCAALGSRRAALGHKLHAILHQCFMMTGSPASLKDLCHRITTWTVDLGVESNIPKFQPVPFSVAFPYFCLHGRKNVPNDFVFGMPSWT